ncbi:unnamed protein product [Allacma fusca]|uniref:Uncharacterized protein n=1 Tax=Allacma fusca TaxID=39272 RepID=A0A8J2JTX4_9HEXA|nr:unnamed protein product [Allacma fusca]
MLESGLKKATVGITYSCNFRLHSLLANSEQRTKGRGVGAGYVEEPRYSKGIKRTKKPKIFSIGDKYTCLVTKKKYKAKPAQHRDWRDFEDFGYDIDPYNY